MSSKNETIRGSVITLKTLQFPKEILKHVAANFDPSVFKMTKGTVKLVTSGKAKDATVDDLMKFPENKPGDIVVWSSLMPSSRLLFIDFAEDHSLPSEEDIIINSELCADKIGVILVTYLLHGSLGGFLKPEPLIPKFAMTATGLKLEQFKKELITSTDAFCRCKFPNSVTHFSLLANKLPMTFLSRIKLSWAGNRVFVILKMVRGKISKFYDDNSAMAYLMSDGIMNASPYFSTHPDHPENPFHDCVQAIYADIGEKCTRVNLDFDALYKRRPAIFMNRVKDMLEANPDDVQEKLPSLDKFQIAFKPSNSIGTIVKAPE